MCTAIMGRVCVFVRVHAITCIISHVNFNVAECDQENNLEALKKKTHVSVICLHMQRHVLIQYVHTHIHTHIHMKHTNISLERERGVRRRSTEGRMNSGLSLLSAGAI